MSEKVMSSQKKARQGFSFGEGLGMNGLEENIIDDELLVAINSQLSKKNASNSEDISNIKIIDDELLKAINKQLSGNTNSNNIIDDELLIAINNRLSKRKKGKDSNEVLKQAISENLGVETDLVQNNNGNIRNRPSLRELASKDTLTLTNTQRELISNLKDRDYSEVEIMELIQEWSNEKNSRQITLALKELIKKIDIFVKH